MTKPKLSAFAQAARLSAIRSRNGAKVAQRLNINQSPTLKPFTSAELRRQHAENEDFRATIDHLTRENAEQIGEIVALKGQRDELLEALREVLSLYASLIRDIYGSEFVDRAHTAIAKAGGAT